MILPTIHSNGTKKYVLINALCEAAQALNVAYELLKRTAPHGRDYYPQGDAVLRQAEGAHFDRLKRLDEIKDEVDALTDAIDELE